MGNRVHDASDVIAKGGLTIPSAADYRPRAWRPRLRVPPEGWVPWRGWFATGEVHWRTDAQPNANEDVEVIGWMAQVGYMIVPQRFEKLQLDFGRVETHFAAEANGPNASNVDEWRSRLQFQIVF